MMHRMAMDYFRQYLIVGGMPQAVAKFVETRDFNKVDRVKRQILLYIVTIFKSMLQLMYLKLLRFFDTIPSQLQKHEKEIYVEGTHRRARMRDYETAFFGCQMP